MAQAFGNISNVAANIASASLVINKPTGVADGDLLVFAGITDNAATVFATLAGWTKLHDIQPNSQYNHQVFYKIAAGEPASYTWTITGGSPKSAGIMGNVTGAGSTVDVQSLTFAPSSTNIVITDITPTRANQMLFWICSRTTVASTSNILPPPNETARGANVNAGGTVTTPQLNFSCEIYPSAVVTTFPWSRGSFSGVAARGTVSFFAFQDAIPVAPANVPLLFCEA
jgi:hypothetical protein